MTQFVIENPILNSPFAAPQRHFRFDDEGITSDIVARRPSSYFVPIAPPRKKGKQVLLDTLWSQDRAIENDAINFIRSRVALWRERGYPDVTPVTRALLAYWQRSDRERRLFFCQVEALETFIYLAEAATRAGDEGILNRLRDAVVHSGTTLNRLACKMATGSGKTVVMAMLIAWQTLNRLAAPSDRRFTDAFLIVTPGITIRDRLRVLLPSDEDNYYQKHDLVPVESLAELGTARIVITNFHAFKARERSEAGKLTKVLLGGGKPGAFTETPAEMVRRVCRDLGGRKGIVILNDEAHHCYCSRPLDAQEKLSGDDRKEAVQREEAARLWISGLEAVQTRVGVKVVYDLSATPFYLRGSGYSEGTLFPWVVSDFSLIDAIESGLVKVPRVPVADSALVGELPTYRELWSRIREELPRKGRGTDAVSGPPQLPQELEGALQTLYAHYEQHYREWERDAEGRANGHTPPVFIVVCSNTNVSKLVFDYIAGHETGQRHPDDSPYVAPGKLAIFSNADGNRWLLRPNTILVDSEQLESGEGMSAEFKKLAATEIAEFKAEYRQRFPGRDADTLTDEDLLREILNTVGKAGKLGERVKCVVSVSMLTEGWDANTVTHILGVRAFSTQLLCEQVVGRGLRRLSYTLNDEGHFDPEYAEVYGVPFSFLPCAGSLPKHSEKESRSRPSRVRALPERLLAHPELEITFPKVTGYRYELPPQRLEADFGDESRVALSSEDIPTRTENPLTLEDFRKHREQEVSFALAKLVLERYFPAESGGSEVTTGVQVWLFPQLLSLVKRWMSTCVVCKDDAFPQLLLFTPKASEAAEKIYRAVISSSGGAKRLRAEVPRCQPTGSTSSVAFDTSKTTWTTRPDKCHLNFVPCDRGWEARFAQTLEEMPEVKAYARNHNLGFKIPYTFEGLPQQYYPDYLLRVEDRHGNDLLNMIVEIADQDSSEKEAGVQAARTLWVPAVNNEGVFGRWEFLEINDPWDAKRIIRAFIDHQWASNGVSCLKR